MTTDKDIQAEIAALASAEMKEKIAYNGAKALRDTKRYLILSAVTRIIDRELDNIYGKNIKALSDSYYEAMEVHKIAMERAALSGVGAPAPLGTIYCECLSSSRFVDGKRVWVHYLTGKRAVLQAITQGSRHPDNFASYSRASVGEYVLRTLKKSGEVGLFYQRILGGIPRDWKIEGTE